MPSCEGAETVVLAGGGSRRFDGGEKALATVDGRPMLDRVVRVAGTVTDGPPIVAVATDDQRERYADALGVPVRFVTDAPGRAGPLAGLASAVEAAEAPWLLVLGCDMPLVERNAIEWLAERRTAGTDAVVPRTDGKLQPLHAWYRRAPLAAALRSGGEDRSLHALVDRLPVTVVPATEAPGTVRLDRSVCNVNTREELANVRECVDD